MSDTNNQEDLSVEDILSSIKNILVDENGSPTGSNQPVKTPEQQELDDVFDLDASMIVEEKPQHTETLQPEKTHQPETTPDLASDIDIEQTLNLSEQIDLDEIPAFDKLLSEEPRQPIPVPQPKQETIVQQAPSLVEAGTPNQTAFQQEAVATNITAPQPPSSVQEDAIDASASLINNFAKVFAEKQQAAAYQNTANSQIANNLSANLENMNISSLVKESIINQVQASLNAHFYEIATPIITQQTQLWLNQNLAAIVEKTIAKEIERVMAKVGS